MRKYFMELFAIGWVDSNGKICEEQMSDDALNVTAEELEVLNTSYNKEHYMFHQQHRRNNTVLFCGLQSEISSATDFIADRDQNIAADITNEIFFKELFSDLTENEKKIVSDYFIMGKQLKETAEELGISTRQVSRNKNSALTKMLKRIKQLAMNLMRKRLVIFCRKVIISQH